MAILDEVDPELMVQIVKNQDAVGISLENVDVLRTFSAAKYASLAGWKNAAAKRLTIESDGSALDLYVYDAPPSDTPRPCLIWFHGGGYIFGSAEEKYRGPMIAERAGCIVISVDYRLAPEHPYPAAIHDGAAVLEWVHENAPKLNIDPARVAIGGASAGGGLAAGLALFNRDTKGLAVCFQLLLYPMLDSLHDTPSGRLVDHPIWNLKNSFAAWDIYLGGLNRDLAPIYASPSRAENLSGLPPAFITVGDVDLFRDECAAYAARLNDAGLPCTFRSYPGMIHGGEVSGPDTRSGRKLINDYIEGLTRGLA